MNQVVLLVLTWLPVVAQTGLFAFIAKFISKKMKEHFDTPERTNKEIKELRSELGKLNKNNCDLIEYTKKLLEDNKNLKMQFKGIKNYGENVKKN